MVDLLGVLAVILLVLANGFFVAAEFALVSVRRTRIAELVTQGNVSAKSVQKVIDNPDKVIAATQLGITLASLGLGWVGEPALSHLMQPVVELFPKAIQNGISHSISAVIAFVVITFLHVVVGELAPKSIALQNPEKTSLLIAGMTLWVEWIFTPAIWILNGAGNGLLKLVGIKPASGLELVHSVAELKMLVSASAEEGVVESSKREMLHAVFDFGNLLVRQIMIPRTEMSAVEADAKFNELIAEANQSAHTRLPVYEKDLDQIVGIVHLKDLVGALSLDDYEDTTAEMYMRPPIFVPETVSVNALLRDFRDKRQRIAIVMDEYGGTAGLVTLDDLLEEIVGKVGDQMYDDIPEILQQPDGKVLISGLALLETVNAELDINLEAQYYDTVAGYFLNQVGRIPKLGDTIEEKTFILKVEQMDGFRIVQLSFERIKEEGNDLDNDPED